MAKSQSASGRSTLCPASCVPTACPCHPESLLQAAAAQPSRRATSLSLPGPCLAVSPFSLFFSLSFLEAFPETPAGTLVLSTSSTKSQCLPQIPKKYIYIYNNQLKKLVGEVHRIERRWRSHLAFAIFIPHLPEVKADPCRK